MNATVNATVTVSETLRTTVRNLLRIRDSALEDLESCNWGNPCLREWRADRIRDIDYSNRVLERLAGALAVDPPLLIAVCLAG